MSGRMPLFSSAPRIRLSIAGATIGFGVGFNINLSIDIEAVYSIGQYNAAYLEPKMYNPINGTIQLLRLKGRYDGGLNNTIVGNSNILGHMDPATVLATTLFDMDVYFKVPEQGTASHKTITTLTSADLVKSHTVTTTNAKGETVVTEVPDSFAAEQPVSKVESVALGQMAVNDAKLNSNLLLWLQIQNCRLTSRSANLTLGQIVNEPVSFQGLLLVGEQGVDTWGLDSGNKQT